VKGHCGQMLRFDIIGSSFAVAVFLLFYYIAVGFFVVFFATNYGYTEAQANSLGNWYWSFQCVALILTGLVSDWLKVRKPFMVVGGLVSAAGVALFALQTTKTGTTESQWIPWILMISIGSAIAFAAWMAAFTETVEKHNPAATATGLAVWGATIRTVVVVALIGLIFAIPAASTLVDKGPGVQLAAAGLDPTLTAAQNATVKAVAADPTIPTKTQALANQYKAELATAAKLKPATQAALAANPTDVPTQAEAISEISGVGLADVAKVFQYKDQLTTAATIDQATQVALLTNPADTAAQTKAVGEIAQGLKITVPEAVAKLQALALVPAADLVAMASTAPKVSDAGAQLTALGKVPAADLGYLAKWGPGLQDQKTVAALTKLGEEAPGVQKALKDSPGQWQRWWWICLAGQILFLPFIFLLTGRWSPRKARQDAKEHAEAVNRELAALLAQEGN